MSAASLVSHPPICAFLPFAFFIASLISLLFFTLQHLQLHSYLVLITDLFAGSFSGSGSALLRVLPEDGSLLTSFCGL